MSVSDPVYAACSFGTSNDGWSWVRIQGALDVCSSSRVLAEIARNLPPDCPQVVLDLEDVTFIDSTGIRVLLQVLNRGAAGRQPASTTLIIYPCARLARRALELIGLERLVRVVEAQDGTVPGVPVSWPGGCIGGQARAA